MRKWARARRFALINNPTSSAPIRKISSAAKSPPFGSSSGSFLPWFPFSFGCSVSSACSLSLEEFSPSKNNAPGMSPTRCYAYQTTVNLAGILIRPSVPSPKPGSFTAVVVYLFLKEMSKQKNTESWWKKRKKFGISRIWRIWEGTLQRIGHS